MNTSSVIVPTSINCVRCEPTSVKKRKVLQEKLSILVSERQQLKFKLKEPPMKV